MPAPPHPLREPVPSLRISIISPRFIDHYESESSLGGQGFGLTSKPLLALGSTPRTASASSVFRGTHYSSVTGAWPFIRKFLEDRYERYTQKFFAGRCPTGRRVVRLEPAGNCAGHYLDRWQARQNAGTPQCHAKTSRTRHHSRRARSPLRDGRRRQSISSEGRAYQTQDCS